MLYVNIKIKKSQEEVIVVSKLKQIRETKGLNQRELSEKSHTPQSIVSALERGVLKPWPKVVQRLAKALGAHADKLFPDNFKK